MPATSSSGNWWAGFSAQDTITDRVVMLTAPEGDLPGAR
jgi:hypothetical protein